MSFVPSPPDWLSRRHILCAPILKWCRIGKILADPGRDSSDIDLIASNGDQEFKTGLNQTVFIFVASTSFFFSAMKICRHFDSIA
jgi:hypothetical protein